jgi:hypothetical protein
MQRTTTWGRLIARSATILSLEACVGNIGDDPGSLGGPRSTEGGTDGGMGLALDASRRSSPDVRAIDGAATPTADTGVTAEPDGGPPSIRDGGTGDVIVPPVSCAPPARQLRLLTRREYRNTVRDLFQFADPALPCTPHAFVYDAAGKTPAKVHVAGTFNGWAKTIAEGGWPLQFATDKQHWTVARDLKPGDYAYKFVLDEREWIADPGNPRTIEDGQGGKNSLLTIACGGEVDGGRPALPIDLTAAFPVESRPRKDNLSDLFPFDDSSEKQVVSPTHIEEYWRAGKTLVDRLATFLPALVPCDGNADAASCSDKFVRQFGLRAFRRPLSEPEIARYKKLVIASTSFSAGLAAAVRAFLSSPNFLYRPEGAQVGANAPARLTVYEVASAISYLFWGSMPDNALFDAAATGQLDTPAGIERQARRLLADPRSRETVGAFAAQWLGVEEILVADKDPSLFPSLTPSLRASMVEETRRFVTNVVFDSSHAYSELLRADYTFVNAELASLYGMAGVTGSALQKQKYADGYRTGLLAQASVLGTYARSDQTSPIKRGLFVRRRLLCQDLPPPPADVPPVPAVDPSASTRERFRQHTAVAGCASCHRYIDGIGFGFERFDAIGMQRADDNGHPIDSSGDMNDVEGIATNTSASYADIRALADILVASNAANNCLATQYYRFARGAFENEQSTCALEQIQARFRDRGYDLQELLIALTQTNDFVTRR